MTIPLVETPLVMVPAQTLAKLEGVATDLQDVIGRTRFIENQMRRMASMFPRDRAPQTVVQASPDFNADPAAVAVGDVPAGGAEIVFASYEVPEHRMAELVGLFMTVRVITNLGAAQELKVLYRYTSPTGQRIIVRTIPRVGVGAGGEAIFSDQSSKWLMPRWKVEAVAQLLAGAGTARGHGSIVALEYNLAGD